MTVERGEQVPTVDLYLTGDGWTQIPSDRVRLASAASGGDIAIAYGQSGEGSQADPATLALVLDNRSGDYSRRNPSGALYGQITRNNPIRIGLEIVADDFDRTESGGWGTADTGQVWTGTSTDLSVSSGSAYVAHASAGTTRYNTLDGPDLYSCEALAKIRLPVVATGNIFETGFTLHTQDTSNFYLAHLVWSTGGALGLRIYKRVAGTYTQLGSDVVLDDTYSGAEYVWLRAGVHAGAIMASAWVDGTPEPKDWSISVDDQTAFDHGPVGIRSSRNSGNTNSTSVEFEYVQIIDRRRFAEVAAWPPRWDLSEVDRWVPIEAGGIMRRLGQGAPPARAALVRTVLAAALVSGIVAYWPLSGTDSGSATSTPLPMPSGLDLTALGLGQVEGPAGTSDQLPELAVTSPTPFSTIADSTLTGVVDTTKNFMVDFIVRATGPTSGSHEWVPLAFLTHDDTTGELIVWNVIVYGGASPGITLGALNYDTLTTILATTSIASDVVDGEWHEIRVVVESSGGTTTGTISVDDAVSATDSGSADSGAMFNISITPADDTDFTSASAGHYRLYAGTAASPTATALDGYAGEDPVTRLARLAAEENVPFAVYTRGLGSPCNCGPQPVAAFLDLMTGTARVDGGWIFEDRSRAGLAYRTLRSAATTPVVELSYTSLTRPFEPQDDDFLIENDITVSRPGGGSYRTIDTGSSLGTGVIGTYEGPAGGSDVSVEADADLIPLADWLKHLGTHDEMRYPKVSVDLTSSAFIDDPDMVALVSALDVGSIINITDLPAWLPSDSVRLLVVGGTEQIGQFDRDITLTCTPADPYRPMVWGTARWDSGFSSLSSDITATSTSVGVVVTQGSWDTSSSGYYVTFGGEVATVSAVGSPSAGVQTFTLVRSVNGVSKSHAAGTPVTLWPRGVWAR